MLAATVHYPLHLEIAFVLGTLVVLFLLFIFSIAAVQAKRRGYSLIIWFFASFCVLNPIYLLVVLGTLPNRARQKLRLQFAAELDAKLAGRLPGAIPAVRPVSDRSLGDLATMDPSATSDGSPALRSLGDEATRGPT